MGERCVFCAIVAGRAPAEFIIAPGTHPLGVVAFVPLNPVTPGHVLFVPCQHVADAADHPYVTADVYYAAAYWARRNSGPFNLITSAGREATQTVRHLHVHYLPRSAGDGLALPWTNQCPGAVPDPEEASGE